MQENIHKFYSDITFRDVIHATPTVLIVEDNMSDAHLIKRQIESMWPHGKVLHAKSLMSAYNIFCIEEIDLFLLDLNLPDGVGSSSVKEIKRFTKNIPIIAVTGSEEEHVAREARKCSVDDFILKSSLLSEGFKNILKKHVSNNNYF